MPDTLAKPRLLAPELIVKIREWAKAHDVPIDPDIENLSEDELTLLWVRLQMAIDKPPEKV